MGITARLSHTDNLIDTVCLFAYKILSHQNISKQQICVCVCARERSTHSFDYVRELFIYLQNKNDFPIEQSGQICYQNLNVIEEIKKKFWKIGQNQPTFFKQRKYHQKITLIWKDMIKNCRFKNFESKNQNLKNKLLAWKILKKMWFLKKKNWIWIFLINIIIGIKKNAFDSYL